VVISGVEAGIEPATFSLGRAIHLRDPTRAEGPKRFRCGSGLVSLFYGNLPRHGSIANSSMSAFALKVIVDIAELHELL
jgi:hypothetical protein